MSENKKLLKNVLNLFLGKEDLIIVKNIAMMLLQPEPSGNYSNQAIPILPENKERAVPNYKEVMKEKAIEAFNEAMIYFESPDCLTVEEALKHFIACLDQGLDSGCSEKPSDQ